MASGPNSKKVTGVCRKLHHEQLHDVFITNIIRIIKSRRITWMGQEAHMGEGKNA
jgi:hypothetical protein